jgi:methylenetetrahydrofolate reductase (NADPH)
VQKCRQAGIDVPIIPGLKILTSKRQLTTIPASFHISLPTELTDRVLQAKDDKEVVEIGIEWAFKQVRELLEKKVPAIHFYIMQNSTPINRLMEKLGF